MKLNKEAVLTGYDQQLDATFNAPMFQLLTR